MGFFKRFKNVLRSKLNSLLDQAEDPKKMLNQAILDLKANKNKAKSLLAKSMANLKLLNNRSKEILINLSDFEKIITNTNAIDDKDIAKQKKILEEELTLVKKAIDHENKAIQTIKQGLAAIDKKIELLNIRAKEFINKKISTTSNYDESTINPLEDQSAFTTFERMEEKIEYHEAQIEALQDMLEEKEKGEQKTLPTPKEESIDPDDLMNEIKKLRKKFNEK